MTAADDPDSVRELLEELARTLVRWSYEGTDASEFAIAEIARAYGVNAEVTFLAESAFLRVGDRTVVVTARPDIPPLDQVRDVRLLVAESMAGGVAAAAALARLRAITSRQLRWGYAWRVLGVTLFAVGFGISIQATWQEVIVSAVCGALVGLLVEFGRHRPRAQLLTPLVAAVAVSSAVLVAAGQGWLTGGPIQLMVPALFFFIPGDALSAAVLELTTWRLTAGAARLVYSVVVLGVLAFGAAVAALLTATPTSQLFDVGVASPFGPWFPWLGWVIFTVGSMLAFSMRPRDFPWALLVVLVTFGVAQLGTAVLGEVVGTFLAAIAMTLLACVLGRSLSRPPRFVLVLTAFFVLTPGSHGLRGLESWLGGHPITGIHDIASMIALLIAIAFGMMTGFALIPRRLRVWDRMVG